MLAVFAVTTVTFSTVVAPLAAQERGIVQVTARVVDASASQRALAELARPMTRGEAVRLYRVSAVTVAREDPARPRRVVTIQFLSN